MREAVIICNGSFPRKAYPRELIRRAETIVCCDGALVAYLRSCKAIFGRERLPDKIVGDMDSISPALKERYRERILQIDEQDTNDQSKAFHFLMAEYPGVEAIHILAATGKREAHTLGNLSLLMEYARETGACGFPSEDADPQPPFLDMVSDWSTAFAITDSCSFYAGKGRDISILTPDNSLTIKSKGLEWPLDKVVFDNWWKATLNRASEDKVELELSHKSLALIILD